MSHNDLPKSNYWQDIIIEVKQEFESESKGLRYNNGKARIDLVPNAIIYGLAKVMEHGATKYSDHNWRKGMDWSTPYSCAMRHALKWWEGEDLDAESGLPHLYHLAANVAMLIEYTHTCPKLDDRFKGTQATYNEIIKPKE